MPFHKKIKCHIQSVNIYFFLCFNGENFTELLGKQLARHNFINVDRRFKNPGSQTKGFIIVTEQAL